MHGVCDHPGCRSVSACRPIVVIKSKAKPQPAEPLTQFLRNVAGLDCYEVRYEVQMEFCSAHQDAFRDKYVMNEASWSAIENQLRGHDMAPPDKDSVRILWEPAAGSDGLDEQGRRWLEARRGLRLSSEV